MPTVASGGHRYQRVHSEVRLPMEVVISRIVGYIFGVIDAFVLMRFALKLFGANASAGFVEFVYGVSDVFMAPFEAIFPTPTVGGATVEWSALLAAAVYALIGWGVIALVHAVTPRAEASTTEQVEEKHDDISPTQGV